MCMYYDCVQSILVNLKYNNSELLGYSKRTGSTGISRTKSLMQNYTSVEMYHELCQFYVVIMSVQLSQYHYVHFLLHDRQHQGFCESWDISDVTNNIGGLFNSSYLGSSDLNSDLSQWNVSNVTNMDGMFWLARGFNCDLSHWDVSNVTDVLVYQLLLCCNILQWQHQSVGCLQCD